MGRVNPGVGKYEGLLEEYFGLARERAALEAEGTSDGDLDGELAAEMEAHEAELAVLLDSFDETDFEILFEKVNR